MLEQYRFPLKDNPGYSASIPQLHRNFLLSADFSVASWLRRLTCDWEIVVSFAAIPHFSAKIGKSSLASVPTSILWYQSKKKIYLSQSMSREHDPLWPRAGDLAKPLCQQSWQHGALQCRTRHFVPSNGQKPSPVLTVLYCRATARLSGTGKYRNMVDPPNLVTNPSTNQAWH